MNGTVPEETEGVPEEKHTSGKSRDRDRGSLSSEPMGKVQLLMNMCWLTEGNWGSFQFIVSVSSNLSVEVISRWMKSWGEWQRPERQG